MRIKSVEIIWLNYKDDVIKHDCHENIDLGIANGLACLSTLRWRVISGGRVIKTETAYSDASYDLKLSILVEHTRSIKRPTTYHKEIWNVKF